MGFYHAETINLSLQDDAMIRRFPVLSLKKRFLGYVKLYTISIAEEELEEAVKAFQKNMSTKLKKEWYLTFHNAKKVVIVFRGRVFSLSAQGVVPTYQKKPDISRAQDKEQWQEMIHYALSLGIPQSQCDFLPEDFERQNYDSE